MSSALYELMPYGAPELIDHASRRMFRATTASIMLWVLVFASVVTWMIARPNEAELDRVVIVPYRELVAPPPLSEVAPPPEIVIAKAIAVWISRLVKFSLRTQP